MDIWVFKFSQLILSVDRTHFFFPGKRPEISKENLYLDLTQNFRNCDLNVWTTRTSYFIKALLIAAGTPLLSKQVPCLSSRLCLQNMI